METLLTDVLKLILELCRDTSCAWIVCKRWYRLLGKQKSAIKYFVTSVPLLEWAHNNGCPWNVMTSAYAALGGHLEILKWARNNGCSWDEWTCTNAAEGGRLSVLEWARANGCPE